MLNVDFQGDDTRPRLNRDCEPVTLSDFKRSPVIVFYMIDPYMIDP